MKYIKKYDELNEGLYDIVKFKSYIIDLILTSLIIGGSITLIVANVLAWGVIGILLGVVFLSNSGSSKLSKIYRSIYHYINSEFTSDEGLKELFTKVKDVRFLGYDDEIHKIHKNISKAFRDRDRTALSQNILLLKNISKKLDTDIVCLPSGEVIKCTQHTASVFDRMGYISFDDDTKTYVVTDYRKQLIINKAMDNLRFLSESKRHQI